MVSSKNIHAYQFDILLKLVKKNALTKSQNLNNFYTIANKLCIGYM